MQDVITLTQQEYNCLIQVFSAALDWKAARLSVQIMQNQGEPDDKVAAAQRHLLGCERALAESTSSRLGVQLFMASQGLYPTGDAEAA